MPTNTPETKKSAEEQEAAELIEKINNDEFVRRTAAIISLFAPPNIELKEYHDPPLSEDEKNLDS
ncbi:MAG: hypothetical protein A2441_03675 [Candidatus Veblenbacteria bacterium RIFOXYC2_FULL_42_11]|uniref:Uncharacterized protein n=1 Tax=Candidatus Veblenbacteria bacterium RIFOXYC2_FULL_42_11 TaxID=1802428 RepID=A0A1G2Q6A5_9BACT|nr:MAG: hypothetical protein UV69_C0014G0002 [Parcubacteria group bacterium GW2011_GWE2_43_12]OHA56070.1 MAG: hypothetical protein A2441_03675 [Candidatus Veblenbacteria bacterium RIFOXYC2_FULL_42_11]HAO81456.1 hypothetical protein [Candidatus Veblenbacteria bacterium]